jgi:hypothetical protein
LKLASMSPGHASAEHEPGSSHLSQAPAPDEAQSGSIAPQPQSHRLPSP